jgi:hypothetical protein
VDTHGPGTWLNDGYAAEMIAAAVQVWLGLPFREDRPGDASGPAGFLLRSRAQIKVEQPRLAAVLLRYLDDMGDWDAALGASVHAGDPRWPRGDQFGHTCESEPGSAPGSLAPPPRKKTDSAEHCSGSGISWQSDSAAGP